MVFRDWNDSYEKLPRYMTTLQFRNPGTAMILETCDIGMLAKVVLFSEYSNRALKV